VFDIAKSKLLSVRLPIDLDKKLSNFSKKSLFSRSLIVKLSLKKYLSGGK